MTAVQWVQMGRPVTPLIVAAVVLLGLFVCLLVRAADRPATPRRETVTEVPAAWPEPWVPSRHVMHIAGDEALGDTSFRWSCRCGAAGPVVSERSTAVGGWDGHFHDVTKARV